MRRSSSPARAGRVRGLITALGVLACVAAIAACASGAASATSAPAPGSAGAARNTDAAAASTGGSPPASAAAIPTGDWPVFGYDSIHSGSAPASGITAANAGTLRLRRVTIDTVGDSSAIELHGVVAHGATRDVIVVTGTDGRTVALDAATGARLWEFVPANDSTTVTDATPVADPSRTAVYTASPNGVVHKLALASGRQLWSRAITDDFSHEKIASALTISGANVIAVTGGYYGDAPPYDGHVVLLDRGTGRITRVWNTECSDRHRLIAARSCGVTSTRGGDAIWSRAGAVIEPGSHRILVATGNGPFDGHTSWGDSVLELTPGASALLHNWTPRNQLDLDHTDTDLGSTSPALLGRHGGRTLAVQGGKQGVLALLDLGRLNGTRGGPGPRLGGELQQISAPGGQDVYAQPAVWHDGRRTLVFVTTNAGTAAFELTGGARPRLRERWSDGVSGTSPVVSGGLLYVYDQSDGQLIIRRPLDGGVVRSLPAPTGHWSSPIVVGGRIIETSGDYHAGSGSSVVAIWHLPGR